MKLKFVMNRYILLFSLFIGIAISGLAQEAPLKTLEIKNGSVHMKGSVPYTQFLKKYKGESELTIHVWYNATSSSLGKKEVKAESDEIYFLYGRNQKTGLSEMSFVVGEGTKVAFKKKKEEELTELIDFFQFEVFPDQKFNAYMAMEALLKELE